MRVARLGKLALGVAAACVLSAQARIGSGDAVGIAVHDARIVAVDTSARPTAMYFTVQNQSKKDQVLVAVSVEACGKVELHNNVMDNGVARMRMVDHVSLPAGKSVAFTSAGLHVMCINPKMPMTVGAALPVWLMVADTPQSKDVTGVQAQARVVTLKDAVKEAGSGSGSTMSDAPLLHNHGSMHH